MYNYLAGPTNWLYTSAARPSLSLEEQQLQAALAASQREANAAALSAGMAASLATPKPALRGVAELRAAIEASQREAELARSGAGRAAVARPVSAAAAAAAAAPSSRGDAALRAALAASLATPQPGPWGAEALRAALAASQREADAAAARRLAMRPVVVPIIAPGAAAVPLPIVPGSRVVPAAGAAPVPIVAVPVVPVPAAASPVVPVPAAASPVLPGGLFEPFIKSLEASVRATADNLANLPLNLASARRSADEAEARAIALESQYRTESQEGRRIDGGLLATDVRRARDLANAARVRVERLAAGGPILERILREQTESLAAARAGGVTQLQY